MAIMIMEVIRTSAKLIRPAQLLVVVVPEAELLMARYLPLTLVVTVDSGVVIITVEPNVVEDEELL